MAEATLIIGCGEVGKRVAQQLLQQGKTIHAVSHQHESQRLLETLGIKTISADLDHPETLKNLATETSEIYYFAPPPADGVIDQRMTHFLAALDADKPPKRIVYISTTGVYGDHQGNWIDESTETSAPTDRAKRRLSAEQQLKTFCSQSGCQFVILRVGGIYCLPKLPLQRIKAGLKILKASIAPSSNRIHADDLASICIAAMHSDPANEIYNVSDGNPSSISDYFIQVAKIFQLPAPQEIDWQQAEQEISPAMLSYLYESKKINIDKLRDQLRVQLKYPTLEAGLKQCLQEAAQHPPDGISR